MSSDVDCETLASLAKDITDNRGRTCPTAPAGMPLIATNCISNDGLYPTYDTVRFVDDGTYRSWFRGHPKPGDLILVLKGSPGRVALAPDPVDFCIAQDMVAITVDETRVYPRYLLALLRSPAVQRRIQQMHVGTLIPHFKKGDFDKLRLPLPDRDAQHTIGDTYFSLSVRIELNRRMSQTLESIVRAIFKSWFVDFDPVRKKMEGGEAGLPPDLAALFPPTLDESGSGHIPQGWRVGICADSFAITMGQSPPGHTYNEAGVGLPFYQGRRDFGERFPARRVYCVAPSRLARRGDTLVSVRAPVGDVNIATEDCCIGRGVAAVRHASGASVFTYEAMRALRSRLREWEAGGTVFGSIGGEEFRNLQIVAPPPELIRAYERAMGPIGDALALAHRSSRSLTLLRDSLLPQLMAGDLRPPNCTLEAQT